MQKRKNPSDLQPNEEKPQKKAKTSVPVNRLPEYVQGFRYIRFSTLYPEAAKAFAAKKEINAKAETTAQQTLKK